MHIPFSCLSKKKGRTDKKRQEVLVIYLWLSSGSPPCQLRTLFLQEGVSEIELTLHLMSFFGGIVIKLLERVKKRRKLSLGKPPTEPL